MERGVGFFLPILFIVFSSDRSHAEPSLEFDSVYVLDHYLITKSRRQSQSLFIGAALINSRLETEVGYLKASVLGNHGAHSPTSEIGDLQIVSNIDTEGIESIKVYELFWAQSFSSTEVSIGWKDLSLSFNITEPALLFINSSFGTSAEFGAAGFRGPSIYPFLSFGLHFWSELTENIYFAGAISDPLAPDHFQPKQLSIDVNLDGSNHLALVESGFISAEGWSMGAGAWNHRYEQEQAHRGLEQSGYYLMSHLTAWSHYQPFVRWGQASDRAGRLTANLATGLVYKQLVFLSDQLGMGYSYAKAGDSSTREEVYELIYSFPIMEDFRLSTSLQRITNPAGLYEDGEMFTLRLQWRPF